MEATIISMVSLYWIDILPEAWVDIVMKGFNILEVSRFMGIKRLSLLPYESAPSNFPSSTPGRQQDRPIGPNLQLGLLYKP
jgi:hypothetical protein